MGEPSFASTRPRTVPLRDGVGAVAVTGGGEVWGCAEATAVSAPTTPSPSKLLDRNMLPPCSARASATRRPRTADAMSKACLQDEDPSRVEPVGGTQQALATEP